MVFIGHFPIDSSMLADTWYPRVVLEEFPGIILTSIAQCQAGENIKLLLSALQCSDDRVVIRLQILQYWYHSTLHTAEAISFHTLDIYWASQVAQLQQ